MDWCWWCRERYATLPIAYRSRHQQQKSTIWCSCRRSRPSSAHCGNIYRSLRSAIVTLSIFSYTDGVTRYWEVVNTLARCLNASRRIPDSVNRYDRDDRRSKHVNMVSLSSDTINDRVVRCTTVFLLESTIMHSRRYDVPIVQRVPKYRNTLETGGQSGWLHSTLDLHPCISHSYVISPVEPSTTHVVGITNLAVWLTQCVHSALNWQW